jgi:hypothetical protein
MTQAIHPQFNPDSFDTLLMIARRHRKIINYYNWVLDRLTMPDAERLVIQKRIADEERALAEIGRLAGLPLVDQAAGQTAPAEKEEEPAA